MSIWRRKRRYEENRRFSERADDALLAIGLVRNATDGLELSRDEEEIREKLASGRGMLEEILEALEDPQQADDYTVALAHQLCNRWKLVPDDVADRLASDIDTVAETEATLTAAHRLEKTAETFEDIEAIAGRISETEAEEMRKDIIS